MGIAKQSKLGIISFIFSIIPVVFFLYIIFNNYFLIHVNGVGEYNIHLTLFSFFEVLIFPLISLVFGILCLFQKKCKKYYAIISLAISGTLGLILILGILTFLK